MARPPLHWYVGNREDRPPALAGFRPRGCEGLIRRLYVRRTSADGRQTWQGIGYICDGCGELQIERDWRDGDAA